jgi:hypothetical protein
VAGYADYIGDGFRYYPTHYRDGFVMELRDEDMPADAERRARVTTVVDERTFALQSSLQGDPAAGPRWQIREVAVRESLESLPRILHGHAFVRAASCGRARHGALGASA